MGASVHAISCFASEEICRLNKPHVAGHVAKIPNVTSTFLPPDISEYLFCLITQRLKNNQKNTENYVDCVHSTTDLKKLARLAANKLKAIKALDIIHWICEQRPRLSTVAITAIAVRFYRFSGLGQVSR